MDFIQQHIAAQLKKIRHERELSLDQLATLSGVSKAMLSQIENGRSNPTVTTLWKIANGLRVSFSTFLEPDPPSPVRIIRLEDQPAIDGTDEQYEVKSLYPSHANQPHEIFLTTLAPFSEHEAYGHRGTETILMKRGTLSLEMPLHDILSITEGMSISFEANVPHVYRNETDSAITFYTIMHYPD